MATMAPTTVAPRDPSLSLAERFGGRFLTLDEADALSSDREAIQYVSMNLEALIDVEYGAWEWTGREMTTDDLGVLVRLADDVKVDGEARIEWAKEIHERALHLFGFARDGRREGDD